MENSAQLKLSVEDVSGAPDVPSKHAFRHWVKAALAGRCSEAEIAIRIVGDAEGAQLNYVYRRKQGATNVLSFPADLPAGVPVPMLGDLVICAPVVAREVREQGKSVNDHWAHLVVHGCLHLLGFDHESMVDAETMESLEREILGRLGFGDPYVPR